MLEPIEMKFVITTEDGIMIAGYNEYDSAELDAKDLSASDEAKKYCIYEVTNSVKLGETILQKTYELKLTLPLPPEEKEEPKEEEPKEAESKEEKPKEESTEDSKPEESTDKSEDEK